MTATANDIRRMIEEAKADGAEYLIIGRDTMDYENFPQPVMPGEDPHEARKKLCETGNTWDECYDLTGDIEAQMRERRAQHFDHAWQQK